MSQVACELISFWRQGMKLTVIGAGFGALTAIRRLRRLRPQAEITLISPEPTFQYYPSLIWVPAGLRRREDILFDIRPLLERLDVQFHPGRVTGVSDGGRRVITDNGEVENDGL